MNPHIKKITRGTHSFVKKLKRELFVKKISLEKLESQIRDLGIKDGDNIFVHSALSQLGYIEGGPRTVIQALLNIIGKEGTLAMPAFIINKTMLNTLQSYQGTHRTFDASKKEGGSGAIAKVFVKEYASHISSHPTHAVAAIGPNASLLTEGHENCNTNFGVGTPLHTLIQLDAKIIGLGSSIANVTFYHVLEDTTPHFPVKVYEDEIFTIDVVLPNKSTKKMNIKAHTQDIPSRIERASGEAVRQLFWDQFTANKTLFSSKTGKGRSWVIKAPLLYDNIKSQLERGITIYSTKEDINRLR